ncbi:MAG: 2,3-bisphosphoglycerate-independent phosphoglycerate mutase [Candidatus Berkelbacteria bacterium]|nr:2,3-bisphosphoglycerate-independent phosphoglycerate mutase [Candidatus Berkelbacteria bacterium]
MATKSKVLLVIMDGWGLSPTEKGNAPFLAKTPTLDYIYEEYPKTSISASGIEVGLSVGEPGNSEVGHMSIGLGRVVWENLPRIDQSISSQDFFKNEDLISLYDNLIKQDKTLHLIGLVSDGGVHSHFRHLVAFLEMAKMKGLKKVIVHFISDGRDTAPSKALEFVRQLESAFKFFKFGRIATIVGRYFAMDRDKNWDRESQAFDLFVNNVGAHYLKAEEAILDSYKHDTSDEFIKPAVIGEGGKIESGDGVILFNHRSDRMRQLLSLFEGGQRKWKPPTKLQLLSMTQYQKEQKTKILFPSINMANTVSEMISKAKRTQFHTAETEKFAHVTYFFKAGSEKVLHGEKDQIVPSKKVPTYDKLPEMSAFEVRDKVIYSLNKKYDFVVVNFANGDMVGHTGVIPAAIKACETVDNCLGEILKIAAAQEYRVFVTADHGNCETMINDETGEVDKEHTTNPVPFVYLNFEKHPFAPETGKVISKDYYLQYATSIPIGVLADVAPSILANMGIKKPAEMSGIDLSVAML